MDLIITVTTMTFAGQTFHVFELGIHHVITESTPSGTVASQTSTGTEYFAPALGVFVAGRSTEVTQGQSITNQFRLAHIGAPTSGPSPAGTPGAMGGS
jgi:hypothetical protein